MEWESTKETVYLPLGCLQGGLTSPGFFFLAKIDGFVPRTKDVNLRIVGQSLVKQSENVWLWLYAGGLAKKVCLQVRVCTGADPQILIANPGN